MLCTNTPPTPPGEVGELIARKNNDAYLTKALFIRFSTGDRPR